MISKNEEYVLSVALANERIASEVVARVIDATPANIGEAQALLDIISPSAKESKEIEEYLIIATAKRNVGKGIAEQLDLIVECLEAQVLGIPGNVALNAAQAKLRSLNDEEKKHLVIACANKTIGESIHSQISVATAQAANIADAV
tara:strand:- start:13347 stop:13784 length:438 start_codon:yes stop_codon:yes gene_type:complete